MPFHPIDEGGACGLSGHSSSRCGQVCASGESCYDSEAPPVVWGQGSCGHKCSGGSLGMWTGCTQVSGNLLGGGGVWGVPLGARS